MRTFHLEIWVDGEVGKNGKKYRRKLPPEYSGVTFRFIKNANEQRDGENLFVFDDIPMEAAK